MILFFILIASLLDIVLIMSGEILFWSLIGVKGLTVYKTVNVLNVGEGEEGGIWSHGLIIEQLNWWWLLPRMSITITDNSHSWIKMELDCVFRNCGAVLVRDYSNYNFGIIDWADNVNWPRLWQRANTQNISFETFYSGQFTLLTQLLIPQLTFENYPCREDQSTPSLV